MVRQVGRSFEFVYSNHLQGEVLISMREDVNGRAVTELPQSDVRLVFLLHVIS
jgi:hypothetical protein